jgi:hypothetical protein
VQTVNSDRRLNDKDQALFGVDIYLILSGTSSRNVAHTES